MESLYNLILDRYPVHRFLHTFVGATLLAIVSTLVVFPVTRWWSKSQSRLIPRFIWLMITALFATWSHVVLDGIMHRDTQPFWPFTARNPLLSLVSLSVLHLVLIGLGMIGLIVMAFQWSPDERLEKP